MSFNQAQAEAIAHREGPCMVLAGPGSGKTYTIAKRIEYLIKQYKVRPEEILVITFTKYAANEMKERFLKICGSRLPVTFGTFHGIYYGILKWAYCFNQTNLLTEEEKFGLIRQAAAGVQWEEIPQAGEEKDYLKELAMEIGCVKNNLIDIEAYESVRHNPSQFRSLYKAYERQKNQLRKIDFEDMLILCKELFEKRPDILQKWQQKFRYILVDEFQDINQAQYQVIQMLAAPEHNLFVVGDDDQSIYRFRGARPQIMVRFKEDYPNARQIVLNVNYRSTSHIVNGSLRVIRHNQLRYEKEIVTEKPAGEAIHVQESEDSIDESKYILGKIREYAGQGIPYTDMAVLFRTAQDVRALTETLTEYQIPFIMKEHLQNIYEHFVGVDIGAYFHLSQGKYDRKYFLQIANRPNRYISRESMSDPEVSYASIRNYYRGKEWMLDRIDRLQWDMKMIRDKTPYAAIQYIRESIGYDAFLREYANYRQIPEEECLSVLEEIQRQSRAYQRIDQWFAHVDAYREMLRIQESQNKEQSGIALLTMHGAKGLEFDTVFVIQCNEDSIPYKKANSQDELEEERRLFYVAMTRAKRRLILSYVKEKNGKDLSPSRFVGELFSVV